ncbi:MAG: ImmA/IrrE family metallo-endopeptidase [Clostridia bacterium]|nr:ImmA/IrrE family metallo-endopeptidase [Clostridia bacterium]
MYIDQISKTVAAVKKHYDESDPFALSKAMGVIVLYTSMGNAPDACKGFFMENCRIRTITLNRDLPLIIQKIILAHELGHAVMHRRSTGLHAFHEFSLFDETSHMEYEANLFAAELLLDDNDVFETLNQDVSFFGAASILCVPAELLDFKFRVMKRKGYKLIDPPLMANSNFLRSIEVPKDDESD